MEQQHSRMSSSYQGEARALVALSADRGEIACLLDQFTHRYSNEKTAGDHRRTLTHLFRWTGRRHPTDLTERDLLAWCTLGNPGSNIVNQPPPPAVMLAPTT